MSADKPEHVKGLLWDFLHQQFPATVGNLSLRSFVAEFERSIRADERRRALCAFMGERAVIKGRELNRHEALEYFLALSDKELESIMNDCALMFH